MLNIKIIGVMPNGDLDFEVNGVRGNGNGEAKQGWDVHWIVMPKTPVLSITEIKMKSVPGNTDIFTDDPPSAQNAEGKNWKASVDKFATIHSEYHYYIEWKSSSGVKTHDPKITVKP